MDEDVVEIIVTAAEIVSKTQDADAAVSAALALLDTKFHLTKGRVVVPDTIGALRIRYATGLTPAEVARGVYSYGEGVTGRVMASTQLALIPDISAAPGFLARVSDLRDFAGETTAFIAVPIMQQKRCSGVLGVYRSYHIRREFAADLAVLRVVAAMLGQLIAPFAQPAIGDNGAHARPLNDIVGRSAALTASLEKATRAAASSATVLLIGESGTGKERFARCIHAFSPRRAGPFISVNCAAIPEHLIESELFGHEKGSFTGASAMQRGKFECANGGTLFLDEIGDMHLDLQAKLLRALQEKTIQRLGGREDIRLDVRIVAATNRNLDTAVKNNEFRLDLYFRLNVIPIHLPALRERRQDIAPLVQHFIVRANTIYGRRLSVSLEGVERLAQYDWPGNVRQLENVIERLAILCEADVIAAADIDNALSAEVLDLNAVNSTPATVRNISARSYKRVNADERAAIMTALREANGNKTLAAAKLDLSARQLHYRLLKLGITT